MAKVAIPDYRPPSEEKLANLALDYYKKCRRQEYRGLLAARELQGVIQLRVAAAKQAAAGLQKVMSPEEAWNLAIRRELLDSESE